jgi:hypothetical protein
LSRLSGNERRKPALVAPARGKVGQFGPVLGVAADQHWLDLEDGLATILGRIDVGLISGFFIAIIYYISIC